MKKPSSTQVESSPLPLAASHFWADWEPNTYRPEILRKDTRIYWKPQSSGTMGECVGTFFGENPGSARSINGPNHTGHSAVVGDPTLQLILDTWIEAKRIGVVSPKESDFIEVLNLYYFRDAETGAALAAWNQSGGVSIYSPAVSPTSKFVLLGWGEGPNQTPQAVAAINLIGAHRKVLIPDSKAGLWRISGPLMFPVRPFPVTPSYVANYRRMSLRQPYINNVAQGL